MKYPSILDGAPHEHELENELATPARVASSNCVPEDRCSSKQCSVFAAPSSEESGDVSPDSSKLPHLHNSVFGRSTGANHTPSSGLVKRKNMRQALVVGAVGTAVGVGGMNKSLDLVIQAVARLDGKMDLLTALVFLAILILIGFGLDRILRQDSKD